MKAKKSKTGSGTLLPLTPEQLNLIAQKPWTKSPVFAASKRESDGRTPIVDLILEVVTTIALGDDPNAPLLIRFVAPDQSGTASIQAILNALFAKHLAAPSEKKRDVRRVARELVIDILCSKPDWRLYAGIIGAFAERNDRDFILKLARGVERKRKPVFEREDWFLICNWEAWNDPQPPEWRALPVPMPPLKYWTDDAILRLLERVFLDPSKDFGLDISGVRTKRDRLSLTKALVAKVIVDRDSQQLAIL